jgi:hypothetical protein
MNTSRAGRLTILAVSVLVLSGCATMTVNSAVERGAELTRYRTFNWAPAEALSTGDPRLDSNRFFHERVQADVEQQLAARGFEKITSATPDLLLHYYASVTQRINLNGADQTGYCEPDDCKPYVYDAGTLTIELVDARSHKLVWRGWAEGTVDGAIDNQELLERRIDDAVTRIVARLPRRL